MSVYHSPQMQVFFDVCAEAGVPGEQVWPRVRRWCRSRGIDANSYRSLYRAIKIGKETTRRDLLHEFCTSPKEALGLGVEIPLSAFDVTGRVKDYLARFAKKNDLFVRHLERCRGDFEVVRAGTIDVEKARTPNWDDPKHQVFDLNIWRPGDGNSFVFRYSDRDLGKEKQNRLRWEGHALATVDAIWLIGVEPIRGRDAVFFILQEHPDFEFELLIGIQLAKLDDTLTKPGWNRELGVGRRVAAFRQGSRRYAPAVLKKAAQLWVEEAPMGAVVPFRETPVPRPRDG